MKTTLISNLLYPFETDPGSVIRSLCLAFEFGDLWPSPKDLSPQPRGPTPEGLSLCLQSQLVYL